MEPVRINLFSDSGAILALDPIEAAVFDGAALEDLNIVLDPDGRTHLAAGLTEEQWTSAWSASASRLCAAKAGGKFVLLLSGEGTFELRVQQSPLSQAERERVVESFEEPLHIRSGTLAITDGMFLFEGETSITEDVAVLIELPSGKYTLHIQRLALPPFVVPTVGRHGTPEYPVLVLVLVSDTSTAPQPDPPSLPRLCTSAERHSDYLPGWNCHAQVMRKTDTIAVLRLMRTESICSGYGQMPLGDVPLDVGDRVIVKLKCLAGARWQCEWVSNDTTA